MPLLESLRKHIVNLFSHIRAQLAETVFLKVRGSLALCCSIGSMQRNRSLKVIPISALIFKFCSQCALDGIDTDFHLCPYYLQITGRR